MKKIICLLAVVCSSYGLFAQDSSMSSTAMMHKGMGKMKDCVYMQNGKMMEMMNGKTMMMDKTMSMKNGTMVMADGTMKMKDGSTEMMKDGECIDMGGKITMMKHNMMMKNGIMMHDSTNAQ